MRFLVIDCEDKESWRVHETFGDLFIKYLKQDGDIWDIIEIAMGESIPEDLVNFQGIVITGSHYDVRDCIQFSWFEELCNLIRKSAEIGTPQIYGGCYGCQIIAHAMGGKSDYNPNKNTIFKAESIEPCYDSDCILKNNKTLQETVWLKNLKSFKALQAHADCVTILPPTATLLANSNTCANELYVCGVKNNIIGFQGHPEMYSQLMIDTILPAVQSKLTKEEQALGVESIKKYEPNDCESFRLLMQQFLRTVQ